MTAPAPPDRDVLARLLEAWFAAVDRGERPDAVAICRDHPDLLPAFRTIVGADREGVAALNTTKHVHDGGTPFPALPGFEVVAPLGTGGRGRVYLARETSLARFVALKVLKDDTADDPKTQERFIREARIAASLEHRNIVPIHAVGASGAGTFIAMKWLSGPALDEADVPLPGLEVARIGAAVAKALHAAHVEGVIHRDIKPGNIMLDGDEPCVLDFGLARATSDRTVSGEHHVSGTLPYMSPEQLRSSTTQPELDGRTDVYSLGATLYELAVGTPPFAAEEPGALIREILQSEAPRIRGVDRDLATIIHHALHKDRSDRYPSAAAMAEDLDRFLAGRPITARPPSLIGRSWRFVRRYPRASVIVAASLLVAAIGAGTFWWRANAEAASLRADYRAVVREIDAVKLSSAHVLLDALARRAPNEAQTIALTRRLQANVLLERLLDHLQERRRAQRLDVIARLIADIDELGGPGGPAPRVRTWHLARATAQTMANESGTPSASVVALTPGRARRALEQLTRGKPWPWTLPAAAPPALAEHLFTAIAMRAGGSPPEPLRQEIARALEADPFDYRARLQQAIWGAQYAEDPHVVLAQLEGLHREGRYAKIVQRAMLHQALALNDPKEIEKLLRRFEGEFERDRWHTNDAITAIDAKTVIGAPTEAMALLDWARTRWPRDYRLEMRQARRLSESDELRKALACVRSARPLATTDEKRFRVDLFELSIQLRIATTDTAIDEETRSGVMRDVTTRSLALARRAASNGDRSDALVLHGRAQLHQGELSRARAASERAMTEAATPSATLLGIRVHHAILTRHAASGKDDEARGIAEAGRTLVAKLLAPQPGRDDRMVTALQRSYCWIFDAAFASYLGDLPATREAARNARTSAEGGLKPEHERFLRDCVRQARPRR